MSSDTDPMNMQSESMGSDFEHEPTPDVIYAQLHPHQPTPLQSGARYQQRRHQVLHPSLRPSESPLPDLDVTRGGDLPDPAQDQEAVDFSDQQCAMLEDKMADEKRKWHLWAQNALTQVENRYTEELNALRAEKEELRKFALIQSALIAEAKDKEKRLNGLIQTLREEIASLNTSAVMN